jgi:hypothetical protein
MSSKPIKTSMINVMNFFWQLQFVTVQREILVKTVGEPCADFCTGSFAVLAISASETFDVMFYVIWQFSAIANSPPPNFVEGIYGSS